jgi:hypothetical protein
MGGACGFLHGCILLRIGQLPDLSREINAAQISLGRLFAGPFYFTDKMASDCLSLVGRINERSVPHTTRGGSRPISPGCPVLLRNA